MEEVIRKHGGTVKVKRMEPEKGLDLGDALGFTIPVFSKKALDCLLPLIENNIEILKLDFDGGDFYAINVTKVINAINYEKSKYKTFRDGRRIVLFNKYAFEPEIVIGISIFKIIDEPCRFAFVSDEFKEIVEKNKLKGFEFKLVWDSEEN